MNTRNAKQADVEPILIDAKAVETLTGCSRWTLYRLQRDGGFPQAIKLGKATQSPRLFVDAEVRKWISDRMAARG